MAGLVLVKSPLPIRSSQMKKKNLSKFMWISDILINRVFLAAALF